MNRFLLFVSLLMLTFVYASCSKNENLYNVTAENGLNVRATPSSNGKVLGKVEYYDRIEVDTIVNGWAQIKYNDKKAYVNAKYIKKREGLTLGGFGFLILVILALLGGGGTVVGAAAILKKDGTPDMRYKVNRRNK